MNNKITNLQHLNLSNIKNLNLCTNTNPSNLILIKFDDHGNKIISNQHSQIIHILMNQTEMKGYALISIEKNPGHDDVIQRVDIYSYYQHRIYPLMPKELEVTAK